MENLRKERKITRGEIVADLIFFCISGIVTFVFVFFFDIHRSFYTWPFDIKFIFKGIMPYFVLVPIGTIIGFILIKLFIYAVKREEHLP